MKLTGAGEANMVDSI